MKVHISFILFFSLCIFLMIGCVSEKEVEQGIDKDKTKAIAQKDSNDMPSFVKAAAFVHIDWNKSVTKIGSNGVSDIMGNPNKVGYIGPDLTAGKTNKWLWHFWGKTKGEVTVVAYHKETGTKTSIFKNADISNWTMSLSFSEINGADSSMASNVMLPKAGVWALLVYVDETLFDTLIIKVKEE
ncbi:DUF4871 domain-containing protein [Bacillus sp. 1P06AnD]|uniref:DUF4871 domain-containing protein n=1 Tax=Bacillus sp. 1P06AnD TaxID=3132208 RepID=UPI0039A32E67